MTAALEGGEQSAARLAAPYPWERPGTHFTGGWVWPRGWVEVQLYSSMTAALEGGERSAARLAATYPRERPGTHFTGGWVWPRGWVEV